jgi:hypothetical protein
MNFLGYADIMPHIFKATLIETAEDLGNPVRSLSGCRGPVTLCWTCAADAGIKNRGPRP